MIYPNFFRLAAGISLAICLQMCSSPSGEESSSKLRIVTTTSLLEDAVRNIAGDSIILQSLMGAGVDPHYYKATQGDLRKLTQADLIIYNGLFLEGKMENVLERLGKTKPVLAAAEKIEKSELRGNPIYQNEFDPHIWFDVLLWKEVILNISSTLKKMDTVNAGYYRSNTEKFLVKLDSLDKVVRERIGTIPSKQRVLITAHDAFGYFGDAYNIEVRGLQGVSTVSEPGLRDISDLVKFIGEREIKALFAETSVSKNAIQAVIEGCRERGFDVKLGGYLYSDALGQKNTPEGTYLGMVNANVNLIVEALK